MSDVLKADYFGHVSGLHATWDAALDKYQKMTWLAWVRNKGAFHYMNASQWAPHLERICDGAYMYRGKRYGDTYFHWAEVSAALPAMLHVNANEPFAGFSKMIDELGALLSDLTDCLALGIHAFIDKTNLAGDISPPVRFDAPPLEPPALHYFFADERLN